MENVWRQSVGIDCAKDELVAAFGTTDEHLDHRIVSNKVFQNNVKGRAALWAWSQKLRHPGRELPFVVEATGVYHEAAALYLFAQGAHISVVLPNKVKHFAATLKTKTVNDKVCAQTIALMGLEKRLDKWAPPSEACNGLKQLSRENEQLKAELACIKNQLHAEESGAWPNKCSIKRMRQRARLIEKQQKDIAREQRLLVRETPGLEEKIDNVCTIPGIGFATAVAIIAETDGFNLIRNKRQLVSYAGLDVEEKESGTSVRKKPKISKKGNKYLRKAMYFPAWTAIRHNDGMRALYERLGSRHSIKMKAAVAVQRKLLELVYTLWKSGEPFDPAYADRKKLGQPLEAALNEMA